MFTDPQPAPDSTAVAQTNSSRLELGKSMVPLVWFPISRSVVLDPLSCLPQNCFPEPPFLSCSLCPTASCQQAVSHFRWTPRAASCAPVASGQISAEGLSHHRGKVRHLTDSCHGKTAGYTTIRAGWAESRGKNTLKDMSVTSDDVKNKTYCRARH